MAEVNRRKKPRVVIIGAGFGGLWAARTLAQGNVDVLVIDKNNYHTFLALLYQVAAAELEAEDIAYPVRSIFWKHSNIDFTLAYARRIDLQNRIVVTDGESISYDYLILATGSITYFFGLPGVAENAYCLKTLEEAVLKLPCGRKTRPNAKACLHLSLSAEEPREWNMPERLPN